MSGLKTRSLGLNTLDTTYIRSLQHRHSLFLSAVCPGKVSWDLVKDCQFGVSPINYSDSDRVSFERLEKPGIEPTTPGLEGE